MLYIKKNVPNCYKCTVSCFCGINIKTWLFYYQKKLLSSRFNEIIWFLSLISLRHSMYLADNIAWCKHCKNSQKSHLLSQMKVLCLKLYQLIEKKTVKWPWLHFWSFNSPITYTKCKKGGSIFLDSSIPWIFY